MGRESHSKFGLMHALSQIIKMKSSISIIYFVFTVLLSKYIEVHVELCETRKFMF